MKNIKIIHLEGTNFDIGYQHGKLLYDDLHEGIIPYTLSRLSIHKYYRRILEWYISRSLIFFPPWAYERIRGMSLSSGFRIYDILLSILIPEIAIWSGSKILTHCMPQQTFIFPQTGCSSFFYQSKEIFVYGRNLDFFGVGIFDKNLILQTIHENNAIPTIGITIPGLPFQGISGINYYELSTALHQHYVHQKKTLFHIKPLLCGFIVSEEVLRVSKTIHEAHNIILHKQTLNSWSYLLASGRTLEASIIEKPSSSSGLTPQIKYLPTPSSKEPTYLTHTNYFTSKKLFHQEHFFTSAMVWDVWYRKRYLDTFFESHKDKPPLSLLDLGSLLTSSYDSFLQKEKPMGRIIGTLVTLYSLLIDWKKKTLSLSLSDDIEEPRTVGKFYTWSIDDLFHKKVESFLPHEPVFSTYMFTDHAIRASKIQARKGWSTCYINPSKGLEPFKKSYELCPTLEVGLQIGIIYFALGRFDEASHCFESLISSANDDSSNKHKLTLTPEYYLIHHFLAKAYLRLGKKNQSEKILTYLYSEKKNPDPRIIDLALNRGNVSKAWLELPFSFYAPLY